MTLAQQEIEQVEAWAKDNYLSYLEETEDRDEALSYMETDIVGDCGLDQSQIDTAMEIVKEVTLGMGE